MHWLWGLRKRKVLKSILHCICMIFISPGNSSALSLFWNFSFIDIVIITLTVLIIRWELEERYKETVDEGRVSSLFRFLMISFTWTFLDVFF